MQPAVNRQEAIKTGARLYLSAKPCKHGNVAPRAVSSCNCQCDKCRAEKSAKLVESRRGNEEKRKKARAAHKRWRDANREQEIERLREWRESNPGYHREWYEKNRDAKLALNRAWRQSNRDRLAARMRRIRSTPEGKMEVFCRNHIRIILSLTSSDKIARTESLLGYTWSELRSHIERQFTKGMSWDNYGEWHIDHIRPVSKLVRQGVTDPAVINALSNLRPMWADDNVRKSDKETHLL